MTTFHLKTIEHKKSITYNVGNPGPALEQTQNVAGLNQLIGFQPSLYDSWINVFPWQNM